MCWNFTTKPRYTINSEYHIHCISTEPLSDRSGAQLHSNCDGKEN